MGPTKRTWKLWVAALFGAGAAQFAQAAEPDPGVQPANGHVFRRPYFPAAPAAPQYGPGCPAPGAMSPGAPNPYFPNPSPYPRQDALWLQPNDISAVAVLATAAIEPRPRIRPRPAP